MLRRTGCHRCEKVGKTPQFQFSSSVLIIHYSTSLVWSEHCWKDLPTSLPKKKIDSRRSTTSTQLWHGVVIRIGASTRWKVRWGLERLRRPPANGPDSSQTNLRPRWSYRMYRTYQRLLAESTNGMVSPQPWDLSSRYAVCWYIPKTSPDCMEHRQEVSQRDIRAYTRSTSR